jgi:hypothetical protein
MHAISLTSYYNHDIHLSFEIDSKVGKEQIIECKTCFGSGDLVVSTNTKLIYRLAFSSAMVFFKN